MKITGHTYSVTIRSQLGNVSGSCHRLCGASAASPEFTHEHCVFAEYLNSADSSYLNRPIVGPTPPKLPAHSSNLRYHRVLTCSRKFLYIVQYFRRKVKCLHKIFSDFLLKSEFFALCTKTDLKTLVPGLFCPISTGNNR